MAAPTYRDQLGFKHYQPRTCNLDFGPYDPQAVICLGLAEPFDPSIKTGLTGNLKPAGVTPGRRQPDGTRSGRNLLAQPFVMGHPTPFRQGSQ